MERILKVAAAIIENEKNEILCALRSPNMGMANLWEFPGGKVEAGENIYAALEREIAEELNCKVKAVELFNENVHEYENFTIDLAVIKCSMVEGLPNPSEHSKLIWLRRENLASLKWAPADIPAVEQLMIDE